jgi:DNA-binding transcriptional MerR regulator
LVSPERTPAGYRTYSPADVERLRFVLTVQRDHYLPLRVIKDYLDEVDAGKNPALPNGQKANRAVAVNDSAQCTRKEMLDQSGALASVLDAAIAAGLIEAKRVHVAQDLVMLKSIVEASKFGIEPRHLRGMRLAVDREMGLVSQAVTASSKGSQAMSNSEFRDKAAELSEVLTTMRGVLTRDALERLES